MEQMFRWIRINHFSHVTYRAQGIAILGRECTRKFPEIETGCKSGKRDSRRHASEFQKGEEEAINMTKSAITRLSPLEFVPTSHISGARGCSPPSPFTLLLCPSVPADTERHCRGGTIHPFSFIIFIAAANEPASLEG